MELIEGGNQVRRSLYADVLSLGRGVWSLKSRAEPVNSRQSPVFQFACFPLLAPKKLAVTGI
jgi:hypothetical protein